jgi:hypothetical protein
MQKPATIGSSDLNEPIRLDCLPKAQQELLARLSRAEWTAFFYLAGGTALALHIGHRRSIDFDFFSATEFDQSKLGNRLAAMGKVMRLAESEGTLHCTLDGIKLSFFHYPHPLCRAIEWQKLHIASILDIAVMKLEAIAGRGNKKDFVDLYFILQRFNLTELLQKHEQKYGPDWSNRYHLLKSLIYFADAEQDPMPELLQPVSWLTVKETISRSVQRIDPF